MGAKRSCWYYDNQMLDKMTSVSLHANTYLSDAGKWEKYGSTGTDKGGYNKIPLCTSILSEDFQVSIANTWTDNTGDPVGSLWSGQVQPFAAYAGFAKDALRTIGAKADTWRESRGNNFDPISKEDVLGKGNGFNLSDSASVAISNLGNWVERHGNNIQDYMNSALISQGTRFTYYSGTGINFGNLQMRFTMFPIWTNNGNFKTVPQQLEDLFPYVIGKYENVYMYTGEETGSDGKQKEYFSTLLGWQHPPGGYQATYEDIDKKGIKGTLKLRIGPYYVLESLICENMSFTLSKQMVKRPENDKSGSSWFGLTAKAADQFRFSPLFADVIMSFRPATKYSDNSMRRFIYGLNMGGDADNERGSEASSEMESGIKDEVKRLRDIYGNEK